MDRHAHTDLRLFLGDIGKMNEQELAAVRSEIDMLTRLTHAGIARCRGSWQDEKYLYSVQEYGIRGDLFIEMFSERQVNAFLRVGPELFPSLPTLHW